MSYSQISVFDKKKDPQSKNSFQQPQNLHPNLTGRLFLIISNYLSQISSVLYGWCEICKIPASLACHKP